MTNACALNVTALNEACDDQNRAVVWLAARTSASGAAQAALRARTWGSGQASAAFTAGAGRTYALDMAQSAIRARCVYQGAVSGGLTARAGSTVALERVLAGYRCRAIATGIASTPAGHVWATVHTPVSTTPAPPDQPPPSGSVGGSSHTWCVSADGLQILGTVTVSASENGARTASLTAPGDQTSRAGQTLTLTLNVGGAQSLLYRGRVVQASYQPDTGTTALQCSDQLQLVADALTREQIERLTPDALTAPNDTSTGYPYLMARLSTLRASAILRSNGVLSIINWGGAGSKTLTRILHGSMTVGRQGASDTSTSGGSATPTTPTIRRKAYTITIALSWIRIARVTYRTTWYSGIDVCKWLDHWPLPQTTAIEQAVSGCGWDVQSFSATPFQPRSGFIGCPGSPLIGLLAPTTDMGLADSAGWTISKRYTRTMQAKAVWRVQPAALAAGETLDEQTLSIALRDPRDGRDWVDFGAGPASMGTDGNGDAYADLIDIRDGNAQFGTAMQSAWSQIDAALQAANAQLSAAMQSIALAVAKAAVQSAKEARTSFASATTIIDPTLDIGDGVTLQHPKASYTGMVTSITHTLDTLRGSATTTVEVKAAPPATETPPTNPPPSFHLITPGNVTGGLLANALQRAQALPTRDASAPLPKPPATRIGGVSPTLGDDVDDPLFQGWVANKPQSVIVAGNTTPQFKPEYEKTGFFVRSPDIVLPDQSAVLDLGTSTLYY